MTVTLYPVHLKDKTHKAMYPLFLRLFFLVLLFSISPCRADFNLPNVDVSGYIGLDLRYFVESSALPGQNNESLYPSFELKPEFQYQWNNENDRLKLTPYLRYDAFDHNRRYFDVREAYWQHRFNNADLKIGIAEVFWGVTESRHLVNIINQVDTVEDIDEEDRLGQPMVNLNWFSSNGGTYEFYLLPGFRERRFANKQGRLRLDGLPINQDDGVYESSLEQAHVDAAFRWSHIIGEWDIGLSHFYGTSREARFEIPENTIGRPLKLIPHYDIIHQTSIDLQWTHDSWLWKLEAFNRVGNDKTFQALVAGFEYAFYGVLDSNIDVSLLSEYLWDNRSDNAPLTPFNNDVFAGLRLAFNDTQNTEILLGGIMDVENQASLISLEASRRIMDSWKVSIDSRVFVNITRKSRALTAMKHDSFINLQLAYYF
ncbi:MAG: hypothetical protein ACKE51_09600 [Methylococcaceae bacterium]